MYRIIKAASASAKDSLGIKENIRDLRKELHLLYKCSTEQDLLENANDFQFTNIKRILNDYKERGMTIDEIIDKMIEDTEYMLNYYKESFKKATDLESKMREVSSKIISAMQNEGYDLNIINDNRMYIYPDSDDHKEVDRIATKICKITDGRTNGTLMGGSWTTLNLRSGDGVPINVGWSGSSTKWAPEGTIFIEIVYNN